MVVEKLVSQLTRNHIHQIVSVALQLSVTRVFYSLAGFSLSGGSIASCDSEIDRNTANIGIDRAPSDDRILSNSVKR